MSSDASEGASPHHDGEMQGERSPSPSSESNHSKPLSVILQDCLEEVIVRQSAEILKLQAEVEVYREHFGPITPSALREHEKVSSSSVPSLRESLSPRSGESSRPSSPLPIPVHHHSASAITRSRTSIQEQSPPNSPQMEHHTPEVGSPQKLLTNEATKLTKRFKQNRMLDHVWEKPKKSSVLFTSPKLCTVHNYTGETVYVTVYDKSRVLSGKHYRISPVFEVKQQPTVFEKPFLRGSRSLWLLACRRAELFPPKITELNYAQFNAFPHICIDFSGEIVVRLSRHGALEAVTKAQWEKETIREQLEQTTEMHSLVTAPPSARDMIYVRNSTELCEEESQFLTRRLKLTTTALEDYLGESLEGRYVPRIAICGSGGGCRSMISTLGFLIGMEITGLLDCSSYVAGVSGSTWTIALWETLGISPSELRENVASKFAMNLISRPNSKGASELVTLLKQKWGPGSRSVSLVDIYGAQLAAGLLHDANPKGCEYKLSHQTAQLEEGKYPMPIYTAVQAQVDGGHNWFEFTPYEVGTASFGSYVPTEGFGRTYEKGASTNLAPEPCLGLLLGMWGSAFCAPIQRVSDELFDKVHAGAQHQEQLALQAAHALGSDESNPTGGGGFGKMLLDYRELVENVIDQMSLQHTSLLAAARFANFAHDPTVEATRQRDPELQLIDAGISFNLPFPTLLRPERQIDIIIACDSSKFPDINRGRALTEAAEWAKQNGFKFPPGDYTNAYQKHVSVFRDPDDPECPIVIYLPMKANGLYSSDFDPQENQRSGGYCSTFNFNMTPEQVSELSGLSRFNVEVCTPVIKEIIRQCIEEKTELYTTDLTKSE